MKIGVFGGTFDPVHTGHMVLAEEARVHLGLDEVVFVPAGQPRLKTSRPAADAQQRLRMVELATANNPHFRVVDVEVRRPGPTYTVDTLEGLHRELGEEAELHFLVGLDALQDLGRWRHPERLFDLAKVVGLARPGFEELDHVAVDSVRAGAAGQVQVLADQLIGISSTEIRHRVGKGLSIKYLVPQPVEAYIEGQELYGYVRRIGDGRPEAAAILELAKRKGALAFGEFQLSAGGTSPYYFDGRLVTLDPEGAGMVARALLPILRERGAEAIAGPTLGADPIVSSVSLLSGEEGPPIPGLIVRKEAKEHGAGRLIEGPLTEGARVAVVDDACSTGANLFHAIDAVEQAGCQVVVVACILDRHQGGSDEIRRRGYEFVSLLEADERGDIRPVQVSTP